MKKKIFEPPNKSKYESGFIHLLQLFPIADDLNYTYIHSLGERI